MKLDFLHKAYKIVLILSVCTYSFAIKANISDTTSSAKTVPIPLPILKKSLFDKEPTLEKTISDGQKQIKYTDDKNVVDCIFFEILSDKNKYEIGEQVKIKIKIVFYDNLNLSYKDEECQKIALKVVLPKGFSQTGGSYYDFIALTLDNNNKSKELEIIGQFYEINQSPCFIVLKGPQISNWETIFIKKGEKCIEIIDKTHSPKNNLNNKKQNIGSSTIKETAANSVAEACTAPTTTPASRCGEGVVTLAASGCSGDGATYVWYNHPTAGTELGTSTDGSFTTPSLSSSTTYSVTCTTNACTTSERSAIPITVTIPNAPTISANGTTTFCERNSVVLTAASCNGSILWSSGQNGTTLSVTTSGTYTATCLVSGCTSSPSNAIIVNVTPSPQTPTITSSGALTFCEGGSVTLTSSSCSTGNTLWSNGQTTPTINVSTSGNYNVTCTLNSCTSLPSEVTSVVVNSTPAPSVTASGTLTFCQGGSVTLTSSPCIGGNLLWSTGQTSTAITVNSSGNYTVTCNQNNCLSLPSALTTVVVNPTPTTPTITVSGALTFCEGGSVTLTASACTDGSILWSSGQSTNPIIVTSSGNYSVICSKNGCSSLSSSPTTVMVNPRPATPVISNNSSLSFCEGSNAQLQSTSCPSGTLSWYRNGVLVQTSTSSTTYTATLAGTYYVICKNQFACNSLQSNSLVVTVKAKAVVQWEPTICSGSSVALNATGCSGTYKWYKYTAQNTLIGTGASYQTENLFTTQTSTTYTYIVKCEYSDCTTSESYVNVIVFKDSPAPPSNYSTSRFVCYNQRPTMQGSCPTNTSLVWKISGESNAYTGTLPRVTTPITTYVPYCVNRLIMLLGIPYGGCWSSAGPSITVYGSSSIPSTPVITASKTTFCEGSTEPVVLSAANCIGTVNWQWTNADLSTGSTNSVGNLTVTGLTQNRTYKAKCTNGCGVSVAFSANLVINYNQLQTPVITNTGNSALCPSESTTLTASSCSGTLLWSSGQTTPSISVTATRTYSATCTTSGGCQSGNSNIITITANSISPIPVISASSTIVCGSVSSTLTSTGCPGTVTWSNGSTGTSITVSTPGTYTATCTNGTQCISPASNSIIITEGSLPPTPILTTSKTMVCQGSIEPVVLSAANCDGTINWQWTNANLSTGTTTSIGDLTVSDITQARTYKASCTNICGTSLALSSELEISFQNLLITSITSNTPVNAGYALNLTLVGPLGNTYSWSGPNGFTSSVQNPAITSAVISNSGTYTVTVTSVAGCTATGTVAVTVVPDDCHCEADINLPEWQTEKIVNNAIYFDNSLTNVVENTYLAPTTTIDGTTELNQTITYSDGFGRPMQVINMRS